GPTISTFTLAGGTLESQTGVSLGHVIDVTGDVTVLGSTFTMTFTNIVMGTGSLTIDSTDSTLVALSMSGGSFNALSGAVTVKQGALQLNKVPGVDAIAGPLVVGDGSGA